VRPFGYIPTFCVFRDTECSVHRQGKASHTMRIPITFGCRSMILAAGLFWAILGNACLFGQENVCLWIEAEDFTTATQGVRVLKGERALRSRGEQRQSEFFLRRSGWEVGSDQGVSGKAYIEQTAGDRYGPNPQEVIIYDLAIPVDGDYFFWLRCDSPPPCWRHLSIWFDSRQPPPEVKPVRLETAFWGVWSWWPWIGYPSSYIAINRGRAVPLRLRKGKHKLILGNMNAGLRIDRILVTTDSKYTPFGLQEHYYTGTFEPLEILGGHGDRTVPPEATGWTGSPASSWSIEEQRITRNHFFYAAPISSREAYTTPTMAWIRNLECDVVSVEFDLVFPENIECKPDTDFLLLLGLKDSTCFEALHFRTRGVDLLRFRDSKPTVLKSARFPSSSKPWQPKSVSVTRRRTDIRVEMNTMSVLHSQLPFPDLGAVGIGSYSGGIGFDNIEVSPLADPFAEFDFPKAEAEALRDWVVLRNGAERQWSPHEGLERNDVLLYKAPFWSGSQVRVALTPEAGKTSSFSILFPYADSKNFVQLRVEPRSGGQVELIRHVDGKEHPGKKARLTVQPSGQIVLVLQSSRGLVSVFQEDRKLLEVNEYNLFEGTIGFHFPEAIEALPITSLSVERKDVVVDTFPLDQSGSLLPHWQVVSGSWIVRSVLDGDPDSADGQLIAQGKGEILIGQDSWQSYLAQISAYFGQDTDFTLLGWVGADVSMELHCTNAEIELRKVYSGTSTVLSKTPVSGLSEGWHRIDVAWGDKEIAAQVDGRQMLRAPVSGGTGKAGIRNNGQESVFDDLTIHVLSSQSRKMPQVKRVDPTFKDIEGQLLR